MDALLKQLDLKLSSCLDIAADGFVMRSERQSLSEDQIAEKKIIDDCITLFGKHADKILDFNKTSIRFKINPTDLITERHIVSCRI